jgi:acetylornithine deacetylase/succinyl-diaminopimelate desuccinylase family protein
MSAAGPAGPEGDAEEAIRLTSELIRIESVSGNERAIAGFIASYLGSRGIRADVKEATEGRPNVYARIGREDVPALLFTGHVDTVPIGNGWTCKPLGGEERGGRIFGRGACDMKSGLAAMMVGMAAANRDVKKTVGALAFAAVIDEEVSGLGTKAAIAHGLNARAAIIAEPTELQTICAAKGNCYFRIVLHGRAAHAGSPHLGVNAISAAAAAIRAIERHNEALSSRRHPLLGTPYATVTRISGGAGESSVPDRCEFVVDRRLLPDETGLDALRQLEAEVKRTQIGAEFTAALDMELPAMELPASDAFAEEVRGAALRAGAPDRPIAGWSAACDGGHLHRAGIPTVLFGPGSITQQAHRPDEYVPADEVIVAARTFALLAADALAGVH